MTLLPNLVRCQVVPAYRDDSLSSQITGVVEYTFSDYSLATSVNHVDRVRLLGGAAEYTCRHYRPIGIVGRVSYGSSTVVGQRLLVGEGGIEYYRKVGRLAPFVEAMLGAAHTSSTDYQYLYPDSKTGLVVSASGGLDYHTYGRWGIRLLQAQADHYSFGVSGKASLYWSLGTGVSYSLGRR